MNDLKINKLFDYNGKKLYSFFELYEYPWQVLYTIRKHIFEFAATINGYTLIKDGVFVGESVEISSAATIIGPAVIGAHTKIRPGAFLRENVIIGENCLIGNSTELKNCILLDNVQVPHFNYVGDSILGNNVHFGAGVICSNLRIDGKNIAIKAEQPIETGMRKIGAFIGDGADIGCNCVLNPGSVIGRKTSVYPMNVLSGIYPGSSIVKSDKNIKRKG